MTFVPTPFTTPVISSSAAAGTIFRTSSYISASEYRNAPTAIDTTNLVTGGNLADSTASLAEVVNRASGWIDQYCFHRPDGTLAASPSTESAWVTVKPDGSIALISAFKPILEVVGMGLGPQPSQIQDISSQAAQNLWWKHKVIWLPAAWSGTKVPYFGGWPSNTNGSLYATWTYVNGFPHFSLAASTTVGATSIQVNGPVAGATQAWGAYAGTGLVIHDGTNTESIVVSETPTGLTLNLSTPLQYAHTLPAVPDSIRVSAVPWAVEQACISYTSVLIKAQGNRALQLGSIGGMPNHVVAARAGALEDYERACDLLTSFRTVYLD